MTEREELLRLILLEADQGLDVEEADRLRDALNADPKLVEERERIQKFWAQLRREGQSIGLPENFGDDRIQDLMEPRPEGLLVWGPLRIAAAFVLTATLVHAWNGPRSVGEVVRASQSQTIEVQSQKTEPVHANQVVTADSRPVHVQLPGGTSLELTDAQARVETATRVELIEMHRAVEVRFGERPAEVKIRGRRIQGTRARVRLEVIGDSTELVVDEGRVQVRDGGQRRSLGRGARILLPGFGAPITPAADVSWPIPTNDESSAKPMRVELPPAGPSDEEVSGPDANSNENAVSAFCQLQGSITSSTLGFPIASAMLRLTRVPAPAASLTRGLAGSQDLTQNRVRLEGLRRGLDDTEYTTFTDAAGAYSIDFLPAGLYRVDVLMPRNSRFADVQGRLLRLERGEELTASWKAGDGSSVFGQLVDDAGSAVDGATVTTGGRQTSSDAGGRFALHGVPMTGSVVLIEADGCAPLFVKSTDLRNGPIALRPGTEMRVTVKDPFGAPLNPRVKASWIENDELFQRSLIAGTDQVFRTDEIPDHVPVTIRINSSGFRPQELRLRAGEGRGLIRRVTMVRGQSADVTLRDVSGNPIADAEVNTTTRSMLSDSDGELRLKRLATGGTSVLVQATDRPVEWLSVDPRQPNVVTLPDAGSAARTLRVRNGDGTVPTSDLYVLWVAEDSQGRWLEVSELAPIGNDGDWQLPVLGLSLQGFSGPTTTGSGAVQIRVLIGSESRLLWSGRDTGLTPTLDVTLQDLMRPGDR